MQTETAFNFAVAAIPAGVRFFQPRDHNSMLFGIVSRGILADTRRLDAMPSLAPVPRGPAFVQSVDDAAEYLAGLLRAEVGAERLGDLRRSYASCPDEFAPYSISLPGDPWAGEKAFALAFQYASGGREHMIGDDVDDDAFAVALWEAFAESFFAAEAA